MPNKLGNANVIWGTNATMSKPSNRTPRCGRSFGPTRSGATPPAEQATYRPTPSGGEKAPIPSEKSSTIPERKGLRPNPGASGTRSGPKMISAGSPSNSWPLMEILALVELHADELPLRALDEHHRHDAVAFEDCGEQNAAAATCELQRLLQRLLSPGTVEGGIDPVGVGGC